VVVAGLDVADDGDEEVRERLAIEEERDGAAHGVGLGGAVAGLEVRLDLVRHRRRALVEVHQHGARPLGGSHGGGDRGI
jgi:hypothetical protein